MGRREHPEAQPVSPQTQAEGHVLADARHAAALEAAARGVVPRQRAHVVDRQPVEGRLHAEGRRLVRVRVRVRVGVRVRVRVKVRVRVRVRP